MCNRGMASWFTTCRVYSWEMEGNYKINDQPVRERVTASYKVNDQPVREQVTVSYKLLRTSRMPFTNGLIINFVITFPCPRPHSSKP